MKKVLAAIILILALMFAEYRFIMCNLQPYIVGEKYLYINVCGQIDWYILD